MSFQDWRARLLIALSDEDERVGGDSIDLGALAKRKVPEFKLGWVRKAADIFEANGWVRLTTTMGFGIDGGILVDLTGPGLDAAEEARRTNVGMPPEIGTASITDTIEAEIIPASDRVVRIDDNAPGRADAIANLERVVDALSARTNDLPLDADEMRVAVSELRPFVRRLQDGWVRVGELASAVTKGSPLVWLLDKLGGTVIGTAVMSAIGAIALLARWLIG